MEINIHLKKNFTTQYNKLQAEYGTEIARINGFDDYQLSYTDFIDNFIDTKTVADASIDGNSNVAKKDIVTLLNEMPKPHRKLLAFHKIYYEMQKAFGFKAANDWLRAEWIGQLYMHDADTSTMKHYCYKGDELVTVRDKVHCEYYTFALKDLYENILRIDAEAEEKYDASIEQNALFPKNIEILDVNEETREECWTKITRAVKHSNNKPMRFIKLANGLSQVVTEDHPVITDCGDIPAKDVSGEYRVFTIQPAGTALSEDNYGWVSIIENSECAEECPEVYDLTTETGHFICNNILSHNCFAYDLKDLAEKGLYFIGAPFNAEPANHLTTFVDFIKEFISYASNRSSGAVGLPNLIPYMFYFWKKDVDSDYLGIKSSGNSESYARQNFQRLVYAVNQPYVRDGSQSAFTNTSVFDRPYFEALFGGSLFPDGTCMIDFEEEIIEFQKLYMEVVADIRAKNMFTFPVEQLAA